MLGELRVSQLGVIDDLRLLLGPGMTALTGETGAGKTLVVEAVELLVGGRADGMLVRPGAAEAVVEGRFIADDGGEMVLTRVVPADGRSRGYVDGRMVNAGALAELGRRLVDLHGQHAHQSLFSAPAQRRALDSWAGSSPGRRDAARAQLRPLGEALAGTGGGPEVREREMELLRYQLKEIGDAGLLDPGEDQELAAEEDTLARAASHRAAAAMAYESLAGDEAALDRLGQVVSQVAGHSPLADLHDRLRGLLVELSDAAAEVREIAETLEEDPARLAEVTVRRALLKELCRKYARLGGGLGEVLAFGAEASGRLLALEGREGLAAHLAEQRARALAELREASQLLGAARRAAAGPLGRAVEAELRRLAMPRASFRVEVGGRAEAGEVAGGDGANAGEGDGANAGDVAGLRALSGEEVSFLLAANRGEPLLPLSKVASGGELARAMLALRLVLLGKEAPVGCAGNPRTLIFDEVDAGIGGEAAVAVGEALAELGRRFQVVVVTHLPQVAAFAGSQVRVAKVQRGGRSVAVASPLTGQERVVELSRMMSGRPGSEAARRHAVELLRGAGRAD
ncbi:MAG: DNA repair protein RecN [Acidimicrobiales bacterium]